MSNNAPYTYIAAIRRSMGNKAIVTTHAIRRFIKKDSDHNKAA